MTKRPWRGRLTRKQASCKAIWMKLSEAMWQRLRKPLPKREKGKTWQSMFLDKAWAPLRAREMDISIWGSRGGVRHEGALELWMEFRLG